MGLLSSARGKSPHLIYNITPITTITAEPEMVCTGDAWGSRHQKTKVDYKNKNKIYF